jgi:hypothetical protein
VSAETPTHGMQRSRAAVRDQELTAIAASSEDLSRAPDTMSEAGYMLARRGFQFTSASLLLPFPADFDAARADRFSSRMHHYAFRLFMRGAIQRCRDFTPQETTRYLAPSMALEFADFLVELEIADRIGGQRYRLRRSVHSFGDLLEWFVARELRRKLGFDVLVRIKLDAGDVGGDLDVVAAAEGRLFYFELKSSPPRNLSEQEVSAFFDRIDAVRPDAAFFVVDTALRLGDKVLPMARKELRRRHSARNGRRRRCVHLSREIWALSPRLYLLGARPDLWANLRRAIGEALRRGDDIL